MNYSYNAIYDFVASEVYRCFTSADCSSTYRQSPTIFPSVSIREISRTVNSRDVDLANAEEIYRSTWEVQIMTNSGSSAMSDANEIMDTVARQFKLLGFVLDMCNPVDTQNTTTYRMIGRWHRILADADILPEREG